MKIDGGALEFFQSIPDDMLAQIAFHDMESLERLCIALTLDIQLIIEEAERMKKIKEKEKKLGFLNSCSYIHVIIKVMALHRIIQTHKVSILGQEITYTNKFLKYSKSTSYGFKPSKSIISNGVYVFKYTYEHHSLPPTLVVLSGQKYIVPTWQKVHPETTLADIEWIKPTKPLEVPVEKNTWTFESSSDPGHFYTVKQSGLKYSCNCPGVWRSKDYESVNILNK
jgi:hypothetical protein